MLSAAHRSAIDPPGSLAFRRLAMQTKGLLWVAK